MSFKLFAIPEEQKAEVVKAVRTLLFLENGEIQYDPAINVNIGIVTGQINSYLKGGRILTAEEITQVEMPQDLLDAVLKPMVAGLTRQYIPTKPKVSSVSEGGSRATYAVVIPQYSIDIEDYLKFLRPYRRLGTVRRV